MSYTEPQYEGGHQGQSWHGQPQRNNRIEKPVDNIESGHADPQHHTDSDRNGEAANGSKDGQQGVL